jgi:GAF domain-containing protein
MTNPDFDQILRTAIHLLRADKGNVQLLDEKENVLKIVSHVGFSGEFLHHFATVSPGYCACGMALKWAKRVIIENIITDPLFSHLGPVFVSYGFRAVQSTPLRDAGGKIFGILSTHFAQPRRLTRAELLMLDTYLEKLRRSGHLHAPAGSAAGHAEVDSPA